MPIPESPFSSVQAGSSMSSLGKKARLVTICWLLVNEFDVPSFDVPKPIQAVLESLRELRAGHRRTCLKEPDPPDLARRLSYCGVRCGEEHRTGLSILLDDR